MSSGHALAAFGLLLTATAARADESPARFDGAPG